MARTTPNKVYNLAAPDSLAVRLATRQRREAIALARQYGREDIARQEEQELAILEAYLPVQLSTDDLIQRIDAVMQELGATSDKDLGRVMRVLMHPKSTCLCGRFLTNP